MSLSENLLSYYKLDEASGVAIDSLGINELADIATVTSTTGVISNARQFTRANSETLTKGNTLNVGDHDFSLQAWVKADTLGNLQYIISRRSTTNSSINYQLYVNTDSTIRFGVGFTNNTATECVGPTLSTGVWYHVVCTHDKTAEALNLYIDAGAPTTVTYSSLAVAATAADSFRIGSSNSAGSDWDGAIDEVGVWGRVLTSGEVTQLYNSGSGVAFDDLFATPTSDLIDNLAAHWGLNEASGTVVDGVGSTDMTAVGTPTYSQTGNIGNAIAFGSSNALEAASNSVMTIADNTVSYEFFIWVKPTAFTINFPNLLNKRTGTGSGNSFEYGLLLNGTTGTTRGYYGLGGSFAAFNGATISAGSWSFVTFGYDAAEDQFFITVNGNGRILSSVVTTQVVNQSNPFHIGGSGTAAESYNGVVDDVGFVKNYKLTNDDRRWLYNAGTGRTLAEIQALGTPPPTPPTTALGITAYAPTATGDPTLFEYISTSSTSAPTASTSIAITSTPPIGANIALLLISCDNSGSGADGDYNQVTGVTDDKGNSWHKLAEYSNTNGSAGAGATVSAWYCEVDPNTFESTITTATFSSSIAGRNAAIIYFRSETLSLYAAEILTAATDASTSYGSLSTSLAAKNRMYVRVCAQENETAAGFTPTTGFTGIVSSVQTASGNAMGLRAELKIATSAAETSNPTSSFSSDTASVFIALEADAPGGDGRQTAINTYSMTGVSNAADEVTQVAPVSLGVNSNTADEVTQIATHSLGTNVNTADEVTQIVMYSITSQPIPTPPTTVLGITSFAPSLASGSVTISPVTPPLTTTTFAPVITAQATTSVDVPVTSFGITTYEPSPPASMTVIVPTAELGIVPRVPRILTPGTPGGDDCCCCCWEATVTVSVRFSARHSVR